MRELIIIPVIHDEAEMGSLSGPLKREFMRRVGLAAWERQLNFLEELWSAVRESLSIKKLDYNKVKLYQDGLPVCGREAEIVREVAGQGSTNHQLLSELMRKGATLMGTEDPALLLEEYRRLQESVKSTLDKEHPLTTNSSHSQDLLRRRDTYIAGRIDETLKEGETGILFIGVTHKVEGYLPRDLMPTYLSA